MKQLLLSVVVTAMAGGAATSVLAQAPNLQLTMTDGRVTILARDVPLSAATSRIRTRPASAIKT